MLPPQGAVELLGLCGVSPSPYMNAVQHFAQVVDEADVKATQHAAAVRQAEKNTRDRLAAWRRDVAVKALMDRAKVCASPPHCWDKLHSTQRMLWCWHDIGLESACMVVASTEWW